MLIYLDTAYLLVIIPQAHVRGHGHVMSHVRVCDMTDEQSMHHIPHTETQRHRDTKTQLGKGPHPEPYARAHTKRHPRRQDQRMGSPCVGLALILEFSLA